MYFSKLKKKKDKRGQVNFLDGCVFWLHWHQLLINGNTYFHIQKSYFCSFSFHPVFLILLFVYLKGRASCSFSTNAGSGLPCQLNTRRLVSMPGMCELRTRCAEDISLFVVPMAGTPTCCYASHIISPNQPSK